MDGYHCQCIDGYSGEGSDNKYCEKVQVAPQITCRNYDCTTNDCTTLDRIDFTIYGCSNGDEGTEVPSTLFESNVIYDDGSYYDSWIPGSSESGSQIIVIDYNS